MTASIKGNVEDKLCDREDYAEDQELLENSKNN